MAALAFPRLSLAEWRGTRDALHDYARVLGHFRRELMPPQKHWWHITLSVSGRRVPGIDPANADDADEQMNFGFVTGDSSIGDAYFCATAYPTPEDLTKAALPDGAYWHTERFTGAVMPYAHVAASSDGRSRLLEFMSMTRRAGSSLMR